MHRPALVVALVSASLAACAAPPIADGTAHAARTPSVGTPRGAGEEAKSWVQLETLVLRTTPEEAERRFGAGREQGAWVVSAGPALFEELLALQGLDGNQLFTHPILTLEDGGRGFVAVANEIAYVSDYEVEAIPDGFVADPVVDTVKSGAHLDVQARVVANGDSVRLDLDLELAQLQRPLETLEAPVSFDAPDPEHAGEPVSVELPTLRTDSLGVQRWVAQGDVLVVGRETRDEDGRPIAVLTAIRPTVKELETPPSAVALAALDAD